MTNDCKGFAVVTFAALVADVVLVDEAAVVVPHRELVVVLAFDAVAAYLAMYLVHVSCVFDRPVVIFLIISIKKSIIF